MPTATTTTLTARETELLHRLGMTEDEAIANQERCHSSSLLSFLVMADREENLAKLQKAYDESVGFISRMIIPHEKEAKFIDAFEKLVAELKGE